MTQFSEDPTKRENEIAAAVRTFYENHRETWGERWRGSVGGRDVFIHSIIAEVRRVDAEAHRQATLVKPFSATTSPGPGPVPGPGSAVRVPSLSPAPKIRKSPKKKR